MLRYPPSEISLTMADIHEVTTRVAERQNPTGKLTIESRLRLRRGPERSWDESVHQSGWTRNEHFVSKSSSNNDETPPQLSNHNFQRSSSMVTPAVEALARKLSVQLNFDGAADDTDDAKSFPSSDAESHSRRDIHEKISNSLFELPDQLHSYGLLRRTLLEPTLTASSSVGSQLVRPMSQESCRYDKSLGSLPNFSLSPPYHKESTDAVDRFYPSKQDNFSPKLEATEPSRDEHTMNNKLLRPKVSCRLASFSTPNLGTDVFTNSPDYVHRDSSSDEIQRSVYCSSRGTNPPSSRSVSGESALSALLQGRLSPLDQLEQEVSEQISRAPSVASFYTTTSSLPPTDLQLPNFDSPKHVHSASPMFSEMKPGHYESSTQMNRRDSLHSLNPSSISTSISLASPTSPTSPSHGQQAIMEVVASQEYDHITNTNQSKLVPGDMMDSPIDYDIDTLVVVPPRGTSSRDSSNIAEIRHDPNWSNSSRPVGSTTRIRRGRGEYTSTRHTHRNRMPLPRWQMNQENTTTAVEDQMIAELDVLLTRRRQESDEIMNDTPPREGRFERIANGRVQ